MRALVCVCARERKTETETETEQSVKYFSLPGRSAASTTQQAVRRKSVSGVPCNLLRKICAFGGRKACFCICHTLRTHASQQTSAEGSCAWKTGGGLNLHHFLSLRLSSLETLWEENQSTLRPSCLRSRKEGNSAPVQFLTAMNGGKWRLAALIQDDSSSALVTGTSLQGQQM